MRRQDRIVNHQDHICTDPILIPVVNTMREKKKKRKREANQGEEKVSSSTLLTSHSSAAFLFLFLTRIPFIISSKHRRALSYGADTLRHTYVWPAISVDLNAKSCLWKEKKKKISHNFTVVWLLSRTFNQSFHSENPERNWIRSWALNHGFLIATGLVHIDLAWLESRACVST